MNAHNGFTGSVTWNNLITTSWFSEILKYSKKDHKEWKYWDDFIYLCSKKDNEIFIINWIDLWHYQEVKNIISNDDFDVFCYSKTVTWTTYNSYIPVWKSVILQTKAKIENVMDLNTI